MKRKNDLYNLGNDYAQATSAYFEESHVNKFGQEAAYSDGLYHFTLKPAYELSGGENALNKRILNVLPQSDWEEPSFEGVESFSAQTDTSALFSPDYATGIVDGVVEGPFKKPCGC